MKADEFPRVSLPIIEWQAAATARWCGRYLRSSEVRFGFLLLSLGVLFLCGINGCSFWESTAVAAVVMCMGWYLSTLSPGRGKNPRPRQITLHGDCLEIQTPDSTTRFSLYSACWYVGKISDDPSYCDAQLKGSVPIVVSPTNTNVAVGLDPDLRETWERAFASHQCPRVIRREGTFGAGLSFVIAAAFLASSAAGYQLGHLLADAWCVTPSAHARVVRAFGFISFGFGAYLTLWMTIPGWYRPIPAEHHGLLRLAVLFPSAVVLSPFRWLALPWPVAVVFAGILTLLLPVLTAGLIRWRDHVLRRAPRP